MYVVLITRVIKVNTGATEKFAPRTANRQTLTCSGPFGNLKAAQHAVLTALGTHTCIDAQIWSAEQIWKERPSALGFEKGNVIIQAKRLLAAAGCEAPCTAVTQ
jgi:hypothetical protein